VRSTKVRAVRNESLTAMEYWGDGSNDKDDWGRRERRERRKKTTRRRRKRKRRMMKKTQ